MHFSDGDAWAVNLEAVTLAHALALEPNGRIDLVKMDIEGEVAVLLSAPEELFARIVQLSVEFHDFLDPVGYSQFVVP